MYENSTKDIIAAQEGDKQVLEKLVENNSGLIWNIVKRFGYRGYEMEDLYQIGAMGFIKAIKRFDSNFEVQLSTYAVPYILGEIKRFIRDDGPIKVSRSTKELGIKIKDLQKGVFEKKGVEISILQLEEELHISKEEIAFALDSMNPIESIYVEKDNGNESGQSILETLSSKTDEAEVTVNKIALKEVMDRLEEEEKQIILLRYYKEKTQTQVAKILGISQVQVSRIEKKILQSMKMKLTS